MSVLGTSVTTGSLEKVTGRCVPTAVFCTSYENSLLARTGLALYSLSKLSLSRYHYPPFALHPPYHT